LLIWAQAAQPGLAWTLGVCSWATVMFTWNPDGGALAPRSYNFTPGTDDRIH
jgi:hypothetical protein